MSDAISSVADGLRLAAAPTFAVMALITAVWDGAAGNILCLSGRGASILTGMALMYGLMSAFHLAPWLKLIADRRTGPRCVLEGERT